MLGPHASAGMELSPREGPQDEMGSVIEDSVRALGALGLGSELHTEMLRHLIHGPRTITELVELVYGVSRNGQSFPADYMKIRRAVRKLESRGLVSTRVFGRDKPYRLTRHAIERLYHLARPNGRTERLMSRSDLAIHASTLATGLVTLLMVWEATGEPRPVWIVLFSGVFFYLLGLSSGRILGLLRRIT